MLSVVDRTRTHARSELARLRRSAQVDAFGRHALTDDPGDADLILFVERIDAAGPFLEDVRRHPYVRKYLEKCFVVNPRYKGVPVLPGVYPSVEKRLHHPQRTRSGHYLEVAENEDMVYDSQVRPGPYLYSFVGSVWTSPVRERLHAMAHPDSALFLDTSEEGLRVKASGDEAARAAYVRQYVELCQQSQFVLCPRGAGPSSLRLFESMKLGRAPVIIADDWMPPQGPDWQAFSVTVVEEDIQRLPDLLGGIAHRAEAMGQAARAAWEAWFSMEASFHRVVEWCLAIRDSRQMPEKYLRYVSYLHCLRPLVIRRYVRLKLRR